MFHWTEPWEINGLNPQRRPKPFHSYATVPVGHKVYFFGGFHNGEAHYTDPIDVLVFNTVSLRWMVFPPVTPGREHSLDDVPFKRHHHTAVLINGIVYLWGGMVKCQIILDDDGFWSSTRGKMNKILYAYDVDTHRWFKPKVSGTVPEARHGHSACALENVMYIHGGSNKGPTNTIYKLDTTTMIWSLINTSGTPPPVSSGHSATIIGTKMFVFGGKGNHDNIRVFDTESNFWLNTSSAHLPEERYGVNAFAYNEELYIFGYSLCDVIFYDLWKFNPKTFSWENVEPKGEGPPDSPYLHVMCMVRDQMIYFGHLHSTKQIVQILHLNPSLKTLCKLAVIEYGLNRSGLPHDIRWELAAMTNS